MPARPRSHPPRPRTIVWAAVADVMLVLAFVLIGRGSHDEGFSVVGALNTSWPFLAGLLVGWLATAAWFRPRAILPTGIIVWASTLIVGMLLRWASAQGVAVSFVIVAAIVLAVFLIGWRALALLVGRIRR
jgi:hypothetical protein